MASPTGSAPPPPPAGGAGSDPPRPPDWAAPRPPSPPAGGPAPGRPDDRGTAGPKGTPVLLPDGWVGKVTDKIISSVDGVRAKTTVPIEKIGRIVVWGLLIATAGISLLVVLLIGVLRIAYEAVGNIPGIDGREGRSVWIIDVLFGVVLIVLGLLVVKKGTSGPPEV